MFDYKDAIENAINLAESCPANDSPCIHSGNTLLYFFLRCVDCSYSMLDNLVSTKMRGLVCRREALDQRAGCEHPTSLNVSRGLSTALKTIKDHPLRVYDVDSAMLVKGIGPKIARMIFDTLFASKPPEKASDEERHATAELRRQQRNSIKGCSRTRTEDESQHTEVVCSQSSPSGGKAKHPSKKSKPNSKPTKEYIPTIGSSNYAILITLFIAQRGPDKLEHIGKGELIDRAEASGLSNVAIRNEGGHQPFSKRARFGRSEGNSSGDHRRSAGPFSYGGWSSFGTLKDKGLVAVWSNPIKISLTVAGLTLAQRLFEDALARGKVEPLGIDLGDITTSTRAMSALVNPFQKSASSLSLKLAVDTTEQAEPVEVISLLSPEASPQVHHALEGVPEEVLGAREPSNVNRRLHALSQQSGAGPEARFYEGGSRKQHQVCLPLPPLPPGTRFSDEYDVILLIDGREQYNRAGGASLDVHLNRLRATGLTVEERQLPIGDALWIARSKTKIQKREYVLDYILERKSIDDLLQSIKGSRRYTSQKFFLKRCGLRMVYYLIEGDPDALSSSTEYKTVLSASTSTEVHDGFRVLRTCNVQETFGLYRLLTRAIAATCSTASTNGTNGATTCCSTWGEFVERVKDAKKATGGTTVREVWRRMLCHVPGLGPDGAAKVVGVHPCPRGLYEACKSHNGSNISNIFNTSGSATSNSKGKALSTDKSARMLEALKFCPQDLTNQ
jgi:crossover junction endonuclease MUS81